MSNYRSQEVNQILAKAEAAGMLGSSSTFNKVVEALAKTCNESNFAAMERYLVSLDCAKNTANAGAILKQKANLGS